MINLENSILNICENNFEYLIALKNVNGIGLGFKYINEINTFEPCIHVLVEKKISSKYLTSNNIIPKTYMGIKTDVINVGVMEAFSSDNLRSRVRPIKGGYSVGSQMPDGTFKSGTITCIVQKKIKDKVEFFILGNNHVLAGSNEIPIGSKIIQPSDTDGGKIKDTIGVLSNFIKIKKENIFYAPNNYVDCAIAKIDSSLVSSYIGEIGKLNGVGKASLGLEVVKVGKMTGLTRGTIKTIGATVISIINKDFALFKKQIVVKTSSINGDSGAPLLNSSNEILGLLMTANSSTGTSTFNDINLVLKALKVDLYLD